MKKLQTFAFYALVTPVIYLGAGSVLAQQSTDQHTDGAKHSAQSEERGKQSTPGATYGDKSKHRAGQPDSKTAAGDQSRMEKHRQKMHDQSRSESRGYMDALPANGLQASQLIGMEVKTTSDENVGSVDDLIIDDNGQIVAIVVGVGGLLGMGEKFVAIGWDDVTKSGTFDQSDKSDASDKQGLRIDATREDLREAPEFEKQEE